MNFLPMTEAANLGIHALATINILGKERRLSVTHLAKVLNVSRSHLAKVMQKLVKAGFVDSIRGAKGGFTLIKKPEKISLYQIIKAIDGEMKIQKCFFDSPRCVEGECAMSKLQYEISSVIIKRLKETKLSEINVTLKNAHLI